MRFPPFLDLPEVDPARAAALLLPLPFEGSVSYGKGTAHGPSAIWEASRQVELWDLELKLGIESLGYHSAPAIVPQSGEAPEQYLAGVEHAALELHQYPGVVIGVGGEHSLTPPLVRAARRARNAHDHLTVVQIDAHADLRETYDGTPCSHACAMRRVVEDGAEVIAIGIRSADGEEAEWGLRSRRVRTFPAQELDINPHAEEELLRLLGTLAGPVYLTIDIDGLDPALCPATGTPEPGGLGWWKTLRYLRRLLRDNLDLRLIGMDLCETAPMPGTAVNEFTAARLLAKMIAYACAGRTS